MRHFELRQRVAQFTPRAASEQCQFRTLSPFFQAPPRHEPFFAPDVSARAILPPVKFLKLPLHFSVRHRMPKFRQPVGSELPIVVITRSPLPLLNIGVRHSPSGEMMHRIEDAAMKRAPYVNEHAIDVKDNQLGGELHRSSSMAFSSTRVCFGVPTVTRTKPSRPNSPARSRNKIFLRARRFTSWLAPGPKSTSRKLAPLEKTRAPRLSSPFASNARLCLICAT